MVNIMTTRKKLGDINETIFTPNCITVLEHRYLKKGLDGKPCETPESLFHRVSRVIASIEKSHYNATDDFTKNLEDIFYWMMVSGRFMPNSPTLMNAGREMGMLSACFVLPIEDSIDGIFSSIKNTALIQKAGGGTGFDFSSLRPKGDIVHSSGGTTSGPLSFLKVFSEATEAIQQGAFRRGANMGIMKITHPDIIEFIKIKEDLTKLTNYNLSVSVTDSFINDVRNNPNKIHQVINPRTGESSPLKKNGTDEYWTVGEIFDLILKKAWENAEPGLIFIDRINEHNPTPKLGRIEATNPCGEQPLLPYEACNLGSINIAKFVEYINDRPYFNFDAFKEVIHYSVRFLDDVIDANKYPLLQIDEMCKANRKIGLGVMGFADALFMLNVSYSSQEGLEWGEKLMKFINDEAHNASEELARERGSFLNWKDSIWDTKHNREMRNASATTVAPTGTISIVAGASGGIEPLFSLVFIRNVLSGKKMLEVNEIFKKVAIECGFYSDDLMERIAERGSIQGFPQIPENVKKVFVCAHDIAPEWHVRMQAAFQKHCDSSISKTINFSHDATVEDVKKAYFLAFDLGCKGITVYRDGCRQGQPMQLKKKVEKINIEPVKLPEIMSCVRIRQYTPFGNMHVKISVDPKAESEMEVFAQLGKGGDVASSDLEAICRVVSLFLRCGGGVELVMKQLEGIGSSLSVPSKEGRITSLADGLAKAIQKYLVVKKAYGLKKLLIGEVPEDFSIVQEETRNTQKNNGFMYEAYKLKCPECKDGVLHFEEGCYKCYACGYSKC